MMEVQTIEMHTGGQVVRIIKAGFPRMIGRTILEKQEYAIQNLEHWRKLLMCEPRAQFGTIGVLLVEPDDEKADIAVLILHSRGYAPMCGDALISLARYAVDSGLAKRKIASPETQVNVQFPCGLVESHVEIHNGLSGSTRFYSVPAFAFKTGVDVVVPGFGKCQVDIGYGGAFFAYLPAQVFGLNVNKSNTTELKELAEAVSVAVKASVKLYHPENNDIAYLLGTILTDGKEEFSDESTVNFLEYGEGQIGRSPCGSGTTGRIAIQYHKGLIRLGQSRRFESAVTSSIFTGKPMKEVQLGDYKAIIVQISGKGRYCGSSTFTLEDDDELGKGFLVE